MRIIWAQIIENYQIDHNIKDGIGCLIYALKIWHDKLGCSVTHVI